ncbi:hypothetical protein HDV00_006448 [Rhizophlyctis rosea]|nr:hypothetical protein HDV00_006448 [Rhizophlyctis rosea]
MDPDAPYLAPSYDPAAHTISDLLSILSAHNVPLPTSRARKSVYIDLFNTHIAAKRDQILKSLQSVVPNGDGIVLVGDHSKKAKEATAKARDAPAKAKEAAKSASTHGAAVGGMVGTNGTARAGGMVGAAIGTRKLPVVNKTAKRKKG